MKKKKQSFHIGFEEYIRAVKQADRAIALENSTGFKAVTRVHKSKKVYNRKEGKKIDFDPSFFIAKRTVLQPTYFSERYDAIPS